MLTPGQDHDLSRAEALIENADPDALIGDKAYDADQFLDTLAQREIAPVVSAPVLMESYHMVYKFGGGPRNEPRVPKF